MPSSPTPLQRQVLLGAAHQLRPLSRRAVQVTLGTPRAASSLLADEALDWAHAAGNSFSTGQLRVTVQDHPLALSWSWEIGHTPVLQDHPEVAYRTTRSGGLRHTRVQLPGERYYGLGEVTGQLSHAARRYRLDPRDACNYDPELSDPLYKHWPVALTRQASGVWSALIYDQPQPMAFDFGAERHHYHHLYTHTEVEDADWLRYVLVAAPSLPELLSELSALLGRPALPPRWTLGYLASGMAYTDAPDPVAALERFGREVRGHNIPCDGMHLSSGYSMRGGKRYVFEWNRQTVPDPDGLIASLKAQGLRTIANVKPALLHSHPAYAELDAAGAFIRDAQGSSVTAPFWSGEASWLDFCNPASRAWWQAKLRQEVLERGIDAVWNDNNEFALDQDTYTLNNQLTYPSEQIYAMATASYEVQQAYAEQHGTRPFLISRSASLGVQRLAQTWSGDNSSDWKTLRFNTPMGLSMGLSGYASVGHDVGGFFGDAPSAELFLRWVQQAVGYPRFSIHSWKDTPTEAWTYPEVEDAVRAAIELRYRLAPYLYSLFWEHTQNGAPVQRPLMFEFPDAYADPGFSALLGPSLLLPAVDGPGCREVALDLPGTWYDWHTGQHYGGVFSLPVPLEHAPLLVRAGAIIPLGPVTPYLSALLDTHRELRLYPHDERPAARPLLPSMKTTARRPPTPAVSTPPSRSPSPRPLPACTCKFKAAATTSFPMHRLTWWSRCRTRVR